MSKPRGARRGQGAVPSKFEVNEESARSHVEAALGAVDDGSPRMLVRFHLREIRRILDDAGHEAVMVDGEVKRCAVVPDQELQRD